MVGAERENRLRTRTFNRKIINASIKMGRRAEKGTANHCKELFDLLENFNCW